MIVVEWKLTTFLRQEPWLDAPPRTRGVARLRAARGATGDPTRAWWRVQPRLLTQKRGQFLQPNKIKTVSVFYKRSCMISHDGSCNEHLGSKYLPRQYGVDQKTGESQHNLSL